MQIPLEWKEYELLDSGHGMKLERWGAFVLARPEPQAIWPKELADTEWEKADATFLKKADGKGGWETKKELPEQWEVSYKKLKFIVRPTSFKHTGLFPEQAVNWDWIMKKISAEKRNEPVRVLNLFGYTGGATVAAASVGATVTHLDASHGMVDWTKENLTLSGFEKAPVRLIVDDALKFVAREAKRNVKYDAIIMDPPSYGRGTKGEVWKLEEKLWPLVEECGKLLSENPLFFLINAYTTGTSAIMIENVLGAAMKYRGGELSHDELGLQSSKTGTLLPAGIFCRWEK